MTCSSAEGCDRPVKGGGLCRKHYQREWVARSRGSCSVDGCRKNVYSGGLCGMHYQRNRTEGDPGEAAPRFMLGASVEERLWAKVNKNGPLPEYAPHLGPCWLWMAGTFDSGYGNISVERGGRPAHRVAYELLVGPIPDGLELDHLCRVRACVNPAHLEPVTSRENWLRGEAPSAVVTRSQRCMRGHDLTDPANLKPRGEGYNPQCRTCVRMYRRERYARLGR